jgi:DNA-binding NarL/FixJ family response regulator
MGLSENTVKNYVYRIFNRLGVSCWDKPWPCREGLSVIPITMLRYPNETNKAEAHADSGLAARRGPSP